MKRRPSPPANLSVGLLDGAEELSCPGYRRTLIPFNRDWWDFWADTHNQFFCSNVGPVCMEVGRGPVNVDGFIVFNFTLWGALTGKLDESFHYPVECAWPITLEFQPGKLSITLDGIWVP